MEAVTLADYQRGALRAGFRAAVARGDARPLLFPACIVPSFVLPAVFLTVAGRYAFLKPLRYPLAVLITAFNLNLFRTGSTPITSSINMASAYGAGLAWGWGTLWVFVVLVWIDPWDGERVKRRARAKGSPPVTMTEADAIDEDVAQCLRAGQEYYWQSFPVDGSFWSRLDWSWDLCLAWRGVGWSWSKSPIPHFAPPKNPHTEELVQLSSNPEVTYQGYRRHRTRSAFLRNRLFAFATAYIILDICSVLMTHDPHFILGPPPSFIKGVSSWSEQISLYPGGIHPPPVALFEIPPYLQNLYTRHPNILSLFRSILGLAGVLAALHMFLSFDQFVRVYFGPLLFPASSTSSMATAIQLWNYPTIFGSVTLILDHGLAGFWGGWWHQTFRMAFVEPTAWLVDHGFLPGPLPSQSKKNTKHTQPATDKNTKDKSETGRKERESLPRITRLVGLIIAFTQSALLHAAGSATSLPDHAYWHMPFLFFLLAGVGVVIQTGLQMAILNRLPRPIRRAGNLMFALGWLHATQWLFIDDLARSGIWLFEPVPFSFVRFLKGLFSSGSNSIISPAGSSRAGHAAWRWYRDDFPFWHTGQTWYETGLAV
ncbi:hypothetical protein F503_04813 [Ophiostoma piceae UAMH 11346]|uniref:Wax synthase domain-containing protein n=1 Tax=Ophiostoma piceae (strain UAMH 11346) TaxID=1262450 RepID=S3CTD8_OPHP1|nr:hypothetical protein F503_04813 [Ophiostoma piceae UAMH 11346]